MNADIGRIEYIVSMYIELSEKAQEKIDKEIIKLWVKENLDIDINENEEKEKWQDTQQKATDDVASEKRMGKLEKLEKFLKLTDQMDADKKAAALIAVCRMAGISRMTKPEVKVTVSYSNELVKEVIEESVPEANYDHALELDKQAIEKSR